MADEQTWLSTLAAIKEPHLGQMLGALKLVRGVTLADDKITIALDIPFPGFTKANSLKDLVRQQVTSLAAGKPIEFDLELNIKGKNSGGSIGLSVKNVIAVGSGKGGVGKSTVAATLAYGLQELGANVGLMDADVYGPSVPHLVGVNEQPVALERTAPDGKKVMRIQPVLAGGLPTISMGFFVKADQAVIWRGPMLHQAISQFLQQVDWGPLDYLIIDMPPGTGDVSLTLSQLLGLAGAVVVCSPQQVALLDAVKAVSMFRQVKIPVLGMVENMSGEIFGRGGAQDKAKELEIPFLGELPMEAGIRVAGDAGEIARLVREENPSREALLSICENVAEEIARSLLSAPTMPTLEIL
ncbi:MAG: ATP-binding protein [Planctomyces sp.]|nr:ATP-binding protein [Planctomyces sp.]